MASIKHASLAISLSAYQEIATTLCVLGILLLAEDVPTFARLRQARAVLVQMGLNVSCILNGKGVRCTRIP